MNKNSSNVSLAICSRTWNKETDDLFDFEASDMTTKDFKVNINEGSHYIMSYNEKILMVKDLNEVKKKVLEKNSARVLGEITSNKNGQFQVFNPFNSARLHMFDKLYIDRLWVVLEKNEQRQIEEGDILKLGRVRLKIDKIVLKQNNNNYDSNYQNITGFNYLKTNTTQPPINITNNLNNNNQLTNNNYNNLNNQSFSNNNINLNSVCNITNNDNSNLNLVNDKKSYICEDIRKEPQYICKICFRSESDVSDPLISPCKCSGSMGYMHYKCLKQCINTKINTKIGDNYICYIWKNFECEICLSEYPKIIKYKNLTYDLVDLNVSYEQYMILDYTLYDDTKKKSFRKGIIVVKLNDESEITIGRTQSNTIKLKDISVSRMHCHFTKKEGKIYVTDKGSKFGTLLYLNKPFTLTSNAASGHKSNNFLSNVTNLIAGKNHFSLKVIQNWNFLSNIFSSNFCCKCKTTNDDEFILNIDDMEENETTKIKDNMKILNDSYCDYVLNLETIIKNTEPNNNNSFI